VAVQEHHHSVECGVEGILTQLRQIDECSAGLRRGFYPQRLLDDVIVRGKTVTALSDS